MNKASPIPTKPRRLSWLAIISTCFGFSLMLIRLTTDTQLFIQKGIYTSLFLICFTLPLFLCLLALVLASIIHFLINRKIPKQVIQPLLINVATGLIIFFVPFTDIRLELEFRSHVKAYNEVVELVQAGHLQVDSSGRARLPQQYQRLSRGGEIKINLSDETLSVLFYTSRDFAHSGFMYRADDTPPKLEHPWTQIVRKRPHCYFCASQ
jgi:hypothetical protein